MPRTIDPIAAAFWHSGGVRVGIGRTHDGVGVGTPHIVLRVGGTQQDASRFVAGGGGDGDGGGPPPPPPAQLPSIPGGLGCNVSAAAWADVAAFARAAGGARVVAGLDGLLRRGAEPGAPWAPGDAAAFLRATRDAGAPPWGLELGNEPGLWARNGWDRALTAAAALVPACADAGSLAPFNAWEETVARFGLAAPRASGAALRERSRTQEMMQQLNAQRDAELARRFRVTEQLPGDLRVIGTYAFENWAKVSAKESTLDASVLS